MTVTVFGYLISISIGFYDYISLSPLVLVLIEKISNTARQCLTTLPITSKFVKSTPPHGVFGTLFTMFADVVRLVLSFLI